MSKEYSSTRNNIAIEHMYGHNKNQESLHTIHHKFHEYSSFDYNINHNIHIDPHYYDNKYFVPRW